MSTDLSIFDSEAALSAARLKLCTARPYFSTAIYSLRFIMTDQVPTMGIDPYWRIYYNPEFVESLSIPELAAVLYHEILHLLRNHSERAKSLSAIGEIWNLAADCEINDDIRDELADTYIQSCGIQLPEKTLYASAFNFPDYLPAESYYNMLLKSIGSLVQMGFDSACYGSCGSGSGNNNNSYELGEPSTDNPGKTLNDSELVRRSVAMDAKEYRNKACGTLPGHISELIEELSAMPKIPWQRVLANKVRSIATYVAGMSDYTYSKPHKRSGRILYPSFKGIALNLASVIDTSGSMSASDLEQALSEISSIIKSCCPQGVAVLSVDAEVQARKNSVRRATSIELKGRGGTNMAVGIKAAQKLKPRPDLILVITDGYTPWPETRPKVKTLVCIVCQPNCNVSSVVSSVPKWAEVVVANVS